MDRPARVGKGKGAGAVTHLHVHHHVCEGDDTVRGVCEPRHDFRHAFKPVAEGLSRR